MSRVGAGRGGASRGGVSDGAALQEHVTVMGRAKNAARPAGPGNGASMSGGRTGGGSSLAHALAPHLAATAAWTPLAVTTHAIATVEGMTTARSAATWPSASSFNYALDALNSANTQRPLDPTLFTRLLDCMARSGVRRDRTTYHLVMNAHAQQGQLGAVFQVRVCVCVCVCVRLCVVLPSLRAHAPRGVSS